MPRELMTSMRDTPQPLPACGLDLARLHAEVDSRLDALVPRSDEPPAGVHRAMRHTLLAPGKRLRPLLAILSARVCGDAHEHAVDFGCAIEMIHAASLILDDLPAMDNATLRRGRLAAHLAHGESTAILASVALLNRAFGVIANLPGVDAEIRAELVVQLAGAVGSNGLVGGQHRDLHQRSRYAERDQIEQLSHLKTGVLFVAAAEGGARIARADAGVRASLREFARRLGLAFQTLDDVIDASATCAEAGKDVGRDRGRPSLVSLVGVNGARSAAQEHLQAAYRALDACTSGKSDAIAALRDLLDAARVPADTGAR